MLGGATSTDEEIDEELVAGLSNQISRLLITTTTR